jgi:hypothetical protein
LRDFANATRPLGSSIAILSSAFHLRVRLAHVLFLYRENAADLFPRKIARASKKSLNDACQPRRRIKSLARIARPIVDENSDTDVEDFPDQMEKFAVNIKDFIDCLNEFPEFTDEAINVSALSFSSDLQVKPAQLTFTDLAQYKRDSIGLPVSKSIKVAIHMAIVIVFS